MTKRLYDVLKDCNKEEEVKSEFCKFFKMKINALKSIDHYKQHRGLEGCFLQGRGLSDSEQSLSVLLDEVKGWPCGNSDLTAQLLVANEDRFLAKWLAGRGSAVSSKPPYRAGGRAASMTPPLSSGAQNVLSAARSLYRKFYAEIANTNWMDAKIETWDVGYYQVCKTLKEVGLAADEFAELKTAHDALRKKLLPKVYEYGFLNPDVEYFQ